MRKIQTLMFIVLAMCMLGVFVASSAFAVETLPAEYLAGGAVIPEGSSLAIDVANAGTTLLLLEDMNATGGKVDILCSGLFVGVITGPKDALINEVLNLAMTEKDILCEIMSEAKGACQGTEALVEAVNLPWLAEPLLVGTTRFAIDLLEDGKGLPGYATTCKTILGEVTDTCTGATAAEARNAGTGLEGEFQETEEITTPGSCSLGGANQGLLFGTGIITDTGDGSLLSISS
jgi:hypothetical protein